MDDNSYKRGLKVRREVLGEGHVDGAVGDGASFDMPLQRLICGFAWGESWSSPVLSRRERSLVIIGMLMKAPPPVELRAHVIGALRNGATRDEIRQVLLQGVVYFGFPAAIEAFRIATATLEEVDADPMLLGLDEGEQ